MLKVRKNPVTGITLHILNRELSFVWRYCFHHPTYLHDHPPLYNYLLSLHGNVSDGCYVPSMMPSWPAVICLILIFCLVHADSPFGSPFLGCMQLGACLPGLKQAGHAMGLLLTQGRLSAKKARSITSVRIRVKRKVKVLSPSSYIV